MSANGLFGGVSVFIFQIQQIWESKRQKQQRNDSHDGKARERRRSIEIEIEDGKCTQNAQHQGCVNKIAEHSIGEFRPLILAEDQAFEEVDEKVQQNQHTENGEITQQGITPDAIPPSAEGMEEEERDGDGEQTQTKAVDSIADACA